MAQNGGCGDPKQGLAWEFMGSNLQGLVLVSCQSLSKKSWACCMRYLKGW